MKPANLNLTTPMIHLKVSRRLLYILYLPSTMYNPLGIQHHSVLCFTEVFLHYPHFLIYMAAVGGQNARRNTMIPCLIETMKLLHSDECIVEACAAATSKVQDIFHENLSTKRQSNPQTPLCLTTLKRKFCIGRGFSHLSAVQRLGTHHAEDTTSPAHSQTPRPILYPRRRAQ